MGLAVEMIGNAYKTSRKIVLVILLVISLLWNATTVSFGVVSTVISAAFEAVTGVKTVGTMLLSKKEEITGLGLQLAEAKVATSKAEGTAIGRGLALAQERQITAALRSEVRMTSLLASKWEGKAVGTALALEREKLAKSALQAKLAASLPVRTILVDGVEMTAEAAAIKITGRVKTRTASLATTNLGATFGQAIPWIGVGVVVAATAYELKSACNTMKDMHALEMALNPLAVDDPEVAKVCGIRVPTKEEVWKAIKESPGEALQRAVNAFAALPDVMPAMPTGWADWSLWNDDPAP